MIQFRHFFAFMAIFALGALTSCRSKMDLENIDAKAQVEMGLAIPVGSVHVTIGDLIGNVDKIYIDSIDHAGVLTWRDTFPDGRSFHKVNLADKISTKDFALDVYEKLESYATGGTVYGADVPVDLNFDMPLKLTGINDALGNERMDSAQIIEASFFSTLTTQNFDIEWDWIEKVTLDLGPQIDRPAGKIMTVYDKSQGDQGAFDSAIRTAIDNFTLCMMKKRNLNPKTDYDQYAGNVLDSTTFKVCLTLKIPSGESVTISSGSKLNYNLSVNFITYKAIWGFFKPSPDMFAEVLTPVGESWSGSGFFKDSYIPFSDPKIKVDINTQIAGNMRISNCYVFGEDKAGARTYALFNGQQTLNEVPLSSDLPGVFLDPYTSAIGDSVTLWALFNKDADKGQIDRLFGNLPENIGYKFEVDFDMQRTPQVRLTPDDSININAICTLPMIFHEGVYFRYNDTTNNVNLSQFTIDSLLKSVRVIDTLRSGDLKVIMHAKNDMPVSISLAMRCLDENGNVIMDPINTSEPFYLFQTDTTRLEAGQYTITPEGGWFLDKATETVMIASLNKERINVLPKVKSIVYSAILDDKSMQEAYSKGYDNLSLRAERGFTIKIGLSAKVDAVLDFNTKEENK